MNNIELINFQGNTKGIETSLSRLEKLFKVQNAAVKEVTASTLRFNKQGADVGAVLKGTLNDGRTFTATLNRMVDSSGKVTKSWKILGVSARQAKEKIKDLSKINAEAATNFTNTDIPNLFDRSALDDKQIKSVDSVTASIETQIRTGKISAETFRSVAKAIDKDYKASFTGAELAAANLYRRLLQITKTKVAPTPGKDFNKSVDEFTGNQLPNLFGRDSLDSKKIASFDRVTASIDKQIRSGKISAETFERVAKVIADDYKASFTGAEQEAANLIRRLEAITKVDVKTNFDDNANSFARNEIPKLTNNLIGLGPEQVASVERVTASIDRMIRSGKVSEQTFIKVSKALKENFKQSFTGDEQKAAIALRRLDKAMLKVGETSEKTVSRMLLSWKSLARIFVVQNIHLALNKITSSFSDLIQKSVELDVKVAEISTIAGEAAFQTDNWKNSIRGLSNEFGLSSIDTATAAYQGLSNQIAEGVRIFGFLSEAGTFARVTNSSLEDSTDLLSAALNVYGKEGLTASRASAILFKTIELGRVRASELANDFGSMAILGQQLGLRIEELTGSFASLTIQGVNSSKAITLMRAVMLKLVRPTDAMKNLINSWGVANAEAAIQTFGFQGVLERLNKVALKGGVDALGEVAGRLRTTIGLVGLTGRSFDKVTDSIAEIEKTSVPAFEKAKKAIEDSVGVRAQKQVQQFFNAFESNVSFELLDTAISTLEEFGGLGSLTENIVQNVTDLTKILATPIEVGTGLIGFVKELPGISTGVNGLKLGLDSLGDTQAIKILNNLFNNFTLLAPVISTVAFRFGALRLASLAMSPALFKFLTTAKPIPVVMKAVSIQASLAASKLKSLKGTSDLLKTSFTGLKISAAGLGTVLTLGLTVALEASFAYERSIQKLTESLNALSKKNTEVLNTLTTNSISDMTVAISKQDDQISKRHLQSLAQLNVALDTVLKTYGSISPSRFNLDIKSLSDQLFGEKTGNVKDDKLKFLFKQIKDIQKEVLDFEKTLDTSKFAFDDLLDTPDLESIKKAIGLFKETFGDSDLLAIHKQSLEDYNLTTGSTNEQITKLFNNFRKFETAARADQRLGLIESAREGFENADDALDKFLSKVNKLKDQLKDAQSSVNDRLSNIRLDGLGTTDLRRELGATEQEGINLLNQGNLDAALAKFRDSDNILSKLQSKSDKLSKTFGTNFGSNIESTLLAARKAALDNFEIPTVDEGRIVEERNEIPVGNAKQEVANAILESSLALQKSEAEVANQIKRQIDLQKELLDLRTRREANVNRVRESGVEAANNQQDVLNRFNEAFGVLRNVADSLNAKSFLNLRAGSENTQALPVLNDLNKQFEDIQDRISKIRSDENLTDNERVSNINEIIPELVRLANSPALGGLLGQEDARQIPGLLDSLRQSIDALSFDSISSNPLGNIEDLDQQFDNILKGTASDLLNSIREQGSALEQSTRAMAEVGRNIQALQQSQPVFNSRLNALQTEIQNNTGGIQARQQNQTPTIQEQTVNVGGLNFEITNTTNSRVDFNSLYSQIAQRLQREVRKGTLRFN